MAGSSIKLPMPTLQLLHRMPLMHLPQERFRAGQQAWSWSRCHPLAPFPSGSVREQILHLLPCASKIASNCSWVIP